MKRTFLLLLLLFAFLVNPLYSQEFYTGAKKPGNDVITKSAQIETSVWAGCLPCAKPENEPDIPDEGLDIVNGGCNSVPEVFAEIQPGDVVCGRANQYLVGTTAPYRDTDWYKFILTEEKTLYWSASANFNAVIIIVQGPCSSANGLASAVATPEAAATVSLTLAAGEYWFFIAPSDWELTNEGDYMVTLTEQAPVEPWCTNVDLEWSEAPTDQEVVCDEYLHGQKFTAWLNAPKADGCGTPVVTHDLFSMNVNSPGFLARPYITNIAASFGPQVYDVTGDLKMDVSNMLGGVAFSAGFFTDKIAVIDRGTYNFTVKVKNAQNAGAAGVIICNNVTGNPAAMGGADPSITIPAMMISKADGDALKLGLSNGTVINATLAKRDYNLDCVDLPKGIDVNFFANDDCGNQIVQQATFTLIPNVPPGWDVEPTDKTISCDLQNTSEEFLTWLKSFSATGICSPITVTDDFCNLTVQNPLAIARSYNNSWAVFGPQSFNITGSLALATDGHNSQCCNPIVSELAGKIAVIDRGTCTFVSKVRNAQEAGATGVIICNNAPGFQTNMADDGTGSDITIPVLMVSMEDGNIIKSQIAAGQPVNVTMHKKPIDLLCFGPQSIPVIFTATDDCGNFVSKEAIFSTETWFTINKTVNIKQLIEPGGTFQYNIAIINYSAKELTFHIEDSEFPTPFTVTLTAGSSWTVTYNRNYTEAGTYLNTSVATATDLYGSSVVKTASESVEVLPLFTLKKTVDKDYAEEPGGTFNYTIELVNTSSGNLDIEGVDTNGMTFAVYALGAGETQKFMYQKEHTEAGTYQNTITATATTPNDDKVTKSATTTVVIADVLPQFTVTKSVSPEAMCSPGGEFTWSIEIFNTSPETLTGRLDDDIFPNFPDITLPPGFNIKYYYPVTYLTPGEVYNTATLTLRDNENNAVTKTSTATATVYDVPKVLSASIQMSEGIAGPPWDHHVEGSLADGYTTCLDPEIPFYYFDLLGISSTPAPLKHYFLNSFYLDVTHLTPGFYDYWKTKGVEAGANGWQGAMWEIINGLASMFYINSTGTDLQLIDALEFNLSGGTVKNPLKINGDYPPGTYTFNGKILDENGCESDFFDIKITFNQLAKITSQPGNLVACLGETVTFSVEATGNISGYQWYKDGEMLPGETSSSLTIGPVTTADAGNYYVVVDGTCNDPESEVAKLAVKEVIVDPKTQQYSDPVTFTGIIHNGSWLAGTYNKVTFLVGSQVMGTSPLEVVGDDLVGVLVDAPLLEPDPGNGQMAPGIKTVQAQFKDAGDNILGCIPETELEILPEKAQLAYNGMEFQATASATESKTTVQLIAVINDWDDGWPGDIRNACITFRIYDEPGGTLVKTITLPVNRLIIPGDITAGVVSYNFEIDLGSSDYKTYTVKIIADCYYIARRSIALTVYKPVGDFITGGGHIVTSDSYGTRAGEPETHTNFGFHVKFNKKNTNLIGGMNLIYRRMVGDELHEFQIKSNAMSNLGVNMANPNAKTGEFTTKANLSDLTTGISVEGNLKLIASLTDRGEPGINNDGIGFTLWRENKKGSPATLIFSSSWNGAKTLERKLDGGNLVVHSGFSLLKAGEIKTSANPVVENADLKVYPNPFSEKLRFEFVYPESVNARIDLYDMTGRMVKTIFEQPIEGGTMYNAEFKPETIISGMYFYRMTMGEAIYNGKVVFKKE